MANDYPMLVVSSVGVEEEEDEIELGLGLSIGGSFRKSTKLKSEEQKSTDTCVKVNSESANIDADLNQESLCLSRSMTQTLVGDSEPESGSEYLDAHRKREIHAMRRQEARKKREEKLRKGLGRGINIMNGRVVNGGLMVARDFGDNKMSLEAQRLQNRARDREMRENDANVAERRCKRDKNEVVGNKCIANEELRDLNLALDKNESQIPSHESNATAYGSSSSPIPVVPLQYPYPPLQYVPFANGFAYPCVMPCWAPTAGKVGNESNGNNVQKPVACWSFQPYQSYDNSGQNPLRGSDSEHNSGKDGGNRNAVSNGSPVCSSSVVSDHRRTSQQGGGSSSDTGNHSSHCKPDQSQLNAASKQLEQPEFSVSSVDSTQANDIAAIYAEKAVSSSVLEASPSKLGEQTKSETRTDPVKKPITYQNQEPGLSKVASGDLGKPQAQSDNTPSFSQMPCVSTTGNGPNGKTITGFLYRYTKTEVSIICVCHGISFSPAEFVEHAGGEDISHPLRHITVIPSAFG